MRRWTHTLAAAMLAAGLSTAALAADQDQQQSPNAQQGQSQIHGAQPGTPGQDQAAQGQDQSAPGQDQAMHGQAMSPEKLFVKHVAMGNMMDVKLAQIAQQNASNQQVKDLAQKILQDHQKADEQLKQVAQKMGVDLPQQLPQAKQEAIQCLQSLHGRQFDQEYVCAMKAAHAADISRFQDKARTLQDEQLKQWVQQQLPALQQHEQMAMAASGPLGLDTSGARTAGAGAMPYGEQARPVGERIPGSTDSQRGTDVNGTSPQAPSTPGQAPGSSGSGSSGSGAPGAGTGGTGSSSSGTGSSSSGSGTGSTIGQ